MVLSPYVLDQSALSALFTQYHTRCAYFPGIISLLIFSWVYLGNLSQFIKVPALKGTDINDTGPLNIMNLLKSPP